MKKKSAQQLIEFLLVVPFIIIIIMGIMTEYAYALHVNSSLQQGLKTVTSNIYSKIRPNLTQDQLTDIVKDELKDLLRANNVPCNSENKLDVNTVVGGEQAVFVASYKYISAFTLPNVYFHFLPDFFEFTANVAVPAAFLEENKYQSNITSLDLDEIWANGPNFNDINSFDDSKEGIMRESPGASGSPVNNIVFLIPATDLPDPFPLTADDLTYHILRWDGSKITPFVADFANNQMHDCDQMAGTPPTPVCVVLPGLVPQDFIDGYRSVYAYNDFAIKYGVDHMPEWIIDPGSDLAETQDGSLKRAIALYDKNGNNVGNYDNLNPMYNPSVNKYLVTSNGSYLFINDPTSGLPDIFGGNSELSAPAEHFGWEF